MFLRYNYSGIIWAIFILVVCLMPTHSLPSYPIFGIDKLVHIFLYSVLAILQITGFEKQIAFNFLNKYSIQTVIIFGILFGLTIEILQGTVFVARSFEVYDIIADGIGSGFGVVASKLVYRNHKP
jgi:VanZ family protein